MDKWVGKVAVVTGASAGIGRSIAESLVKAGVKVVGAARRVEKIEELAKQLSAEKGKLHPFKVDFTKEEDILKMFDWINKNLGGVDILINNVGMLPDAAVARLCVGQTDAWRQAFDTNVISYLICSREAIKSMRARDVNGHIVHLSSVVGRVISNGHGQMGSNVYPVTKFAIQAMGEILHQELLADEDNKIKVTILAPGAVKTELLDNFTLSDEAKVAVESMQFLDPKDIADACLYVLGTPPNVLIKDLIITPARDA